MRYVDGFVLAVPTKKLPAYRKMAQGGARSWMKHGALDYVEAVADDTKAPFASPFARLFPVKRGETVVFSYIVYKSRAHRDAVNKKVMAEMSATDAPMDMPFDMSRMAYGGFKSIVEATAAPARKKPAARKPAARKAPAKRKTTAASRRTGSRR